MLEKNRKILLLIAIVSIVIGILLLAIPTITADDLAPTRQKVVGTGYYGDMTVNFNGYKFKNIIYGTLSYEEKEAYVNLNLNKMFPVFDGYAVYNGKRYDASGFYFMHDNVFCGIWQISCFTGYMQAIVSNY